MENQRLLQQLIRNTGLSEEEALKALSIVARYTKEKFPILEGSINSYLKEEFKNADPDVVFRVFGDE
jgi:hypothetical protein